MTKYYFDTCIWRDFYENRTGLRGKPLGRYAAQLFLKIIKKKLILCYSDLIVKELNVDYSKTEIKDMLNFLFLSNVLIKVEMREVDYRKAKDIAQERNLPAADVLHAILSKNNGAIFISQDKHAQKLKDIVEIKRPEEID